MRGSSARMLTAFAVMLIGLGGCAGGGIFDPAPYEPTRGPFGADASLPGQDSQSRHASSTALTFATHQAAAAGLRGLGDNYSDARNRLMREQMRFDIVLLGTAAAAVVNPLFDGAQRSTLALGLGSGGLGVGRSYLAGPLRVTAYQSAAASLYCAAEVADEVDAAGVGLPALRSSLDGKLASAGTANLAPAGVSLVQAARERAVKAQQDSLAAEATHAAAPRRLQAFAGQVVRATTQRLVTGMLDVKTALDSLRALSQQPSGGTTPAPGGAAAAAAALGGVRTTAPQRSAAEIAADLDATSLAATRASAAVQEAWGRMQSTCVLQN